MSAIQQFICILCFAQICLFTLRTHISSADYTNTSFFPLCAYLLISPFLPSPCSKRRAFVHGSTGPTMTSSCLFYLESIRLPTIFIPTLTHLEISRHDGFRTENENLRQSEFLNCMSPIMVFLGLQLVSKCNIRYLHKNPGVLFYMHVQYICGIFPLVAFQLMNVLSYAFNFEWEKRDEMAEGLSIWRR